MPYEFLDHTGDTAVMITATDEGGLLREAARSLVAVLIDRDEGGPLERGERIPLDLTTEDGESLLIDFLNELIFLFDSRRFLFADAVWEEVALGEPARLRGTLVGDTLDPERHVPLTEVKAATFHGVDIRRDETGLATTVVFDL